MTPPGATTEPLLLCRQPILDRAGAMYGFELLFRAGDGETACFADAVAATSHVVYSAFAELGVERALGPYRGFVNCDERMLLMPGLLDVLPRERVVLEVLESVTPTADMLARLTELRAAGYTLALDDYVPDNHRQDELLPFVQIVKVDAEAVEPARLPAIVAALRRFPVQLLAEKVETQDQAAQYRAAGFDLFQGYFFARPTVISSRKLSLPQLTLLRVLSLLLEDADTHAVVEELKRQPGLTVNLLKIANSAAVAPTTRVGSIMQAVVVLGRKQLERWVQLLLYTEPGTRQLANPLLLLAATRGRLMEKLAELLWPGRRDCADQAFLVGMLSLTPAMFGVAMEDILGALPLRAEVSGAIRSCDGPLGNLLA
ncbi:MAG TPA: EAL domain-containing protein, partial [Casimicrobiaceae bacterium]|nr:EAL domain-containing protein [Casimicrobiaceae bacterium]